MVDSRVDSKVLREELLRAATIALDVPHSAMYAVPSSGLHDKSEEQLRKLVCDALVVLERLWVRLEKQRDADDEREMLRREREGV